MANNPSPPSGTTTTTSPPQFSTLLGSTIESILHELLHSRSIYPPDSFILHRFLGVRCHASRVPQVGDYISNFLSVAIPSIVCGMGDCISLIILEEEVVAAGGGGGGGGGGNNGVGERTGGTKTIERFVFSFQMDTVIGNAATEEANAAVQLAQQNGNDNNNSQMMMLDMEDSMLAHRRDTEMATEARSQLERQMRACLLGVLALRKRRRRKDERPENMSFKLCLHVGAEQDNKTQHNNSMAVDDGEVLRNNRSADSSCPELMRALRQGEWLQPEESSCLFSPNNSSTDTNTTQKNGTPSKGLLRPIKNVNLPSCGMRMQVGFEVDPF